MRRRVRETHQSDGVSKFSGGAFHAPYRAFIAKTRQGESTKENMDSRGIHRCFGLSCLRVFVVRIVRPGAGQRSRHTPCAVHLTGRRRVRATYQFDGVSKFTGGAFHAPYRVSPPTVFSRQERIMHSSFTPNVGLGVLARNRVRASTHPTIRGKNELCTSGSRQISEKSSTRNIVPKSFARLQLRKPAGRRFSFLRMPLQQTMSERTI
jgi:hypothetical protein